MAYEAYIDATYYSGAYKGQAIPEADFPRLALRASDEIDTLTGQRIRQGGLATYSLNDQELIKRATCVVAEWLGQEDQLGAAGGALASSEKVSGYSFTMDASEITRARTAALLRAGDILLYTGLLYRGLPR